jgi:hypothetical protein
MSSLRALLCILSVSSFCSAARADDEENPRRFATYMDYRIMSGDREGSVEAGTQRVEWSGHAFDVFGYGQPTSSGKAHYREAPGPRRYGAPTGMSHGTLVELTTYQSDAENVRAELRFDLCQPHASESADFIANAGTACEVSGNFRVRKTYRVDLARDGDTPRWAEFAFETWENRDGLNVGGAPAKTPFRQAA